MVHPIVNSIIYLSGNSERSRQGAPHSCPCFCVSQVCLQYSVAPELAGATGMCDNPVCFNSASEDTYAQAPQG